MGLDNVNTKSLQKGGTEGHSRVIKRLSNIAPHENIKTTGAILEDLQRDF